jgi:hypothetical protein
MAVRLHVRTLFLGLPDLLLLGIVERRVLVRNEVSKRRRGSPPCPVPILFPRKELGGKLLAPFVEMGQVEAAEIAAFHAWPWRLTEVWNEHLVKLE